MKETKEQAEVKKENKTVNNSKMEKESIEKTLKSLPEEDLKELKSIVSGRKFCKKGRRLKDITREELERYEYENNTSYLTIQAMENQKTGYQIKTSFIQEKERTAYA
mgnify:CR=1 FL=1